MSVKSRHYILLAMAFFAISLPEAFPASGQAKDSPDLSVGPDDVRMEARGEGGYDLYIRAKPGIASVLLTESTKDPVMKADNFAYRAVDYNDVNGNETRLLNGKPLPASSRLYSLISSTPLPDAAFGSSFHILIPSVLVYGYPWSRSGTVSVGQGTYINIRAFEKRYADYSGPFRDNPFKIAISTKPIPSSPEPAAMKTAPQIQEQVVPPPPPVDDRPSSKITGLIDVGSGKSLDLVVCLDTTSSMEPYIQDIQKNFGHMLRERVSGSAHFRIGVVLYKDYWPDEYITRKYPFTSDISVIERIVNSVTVYGGRDIPEAEVEALYAAATEFDWSAEKRQTILLSDAPPHPDPRGKILFDDVVREAGARHIEIDTVTEPVKISPPKPDHPELENEMKRISDLSANGATLRLFALADSPASPGAAEAVSIQAVSPTPQALLEDKLAAAFSANPKVELLRLGKAAVAGGALAPDIAAVRQKAAAMGATHFLISRTSVSGAFSETVSRLMDVKTGLELAHDVVWRADSGGAEAVFVNGARVQ